MSYSTLEQVKIRLRQYDVVNVNGSNSTIAFNHEEENVIIEQLIEKAKQDIILYRRYPAHYTDVQIEQDIDIKYHNVLIDLVLFDYSVEGADYETQHNENGVNRSFIKRESILARVLPFCKVL